MSYREVASRVGEYVIQIGGTEYSSANSPWRSFKTATLGWALGKLATVYLAVMQMGYVHNRGKGRRADCIMVTADTKTLDCGLCAV